MYDIIPDIHGQADKLTARLTALGYHERAGAWRHAEANRMCLFLGDFIDRGTQNGKVIEIVRRMMDAGTALAVMGNHELNAIHFHTRDPRSRHPLRPHNNKNIEQHRSFLEEFPSGADHTDDVISWMKSLPLFLELEGLRLVHACWDEETISELGAVTDSGVLSDEQLILCAGTDPQLFKLVETTTKGPEVALPIGYTIVDKQGTPRSDVRLPSTPQ